MITIVWVGVLLVAAGSLPALAIVRTPVMAIVVAPLVAGLLCAGAVVVMLLTGSGLPTALALILLAAWVSSAYAVWKRRQQIFSRSEGQPVWAPILVASAIVAPLWTLRRPPGDWDAISIWFFHARWYFAGAAKTLAAMTNPAFAFSHPDYPPLGSATAAGVWVVQGGPDLRTAQVAIAIITWSAVLCLCAGVVWLFKGAGRRIAVVFASLLGLAAYGMSGWVGTDGYVDLLWAAAMSAGVLFLLIAPRDERFIRIGATMVAVAALTKNEAAVSALVVVILATFRHRRSWRASAVIIPAGLAGVGWMVIAGAIGAVSDIDGSKAIAQLIPPTPTALSRAWFSIVALAIKMKLVLLGAVAVGVAGSIWLKGPRSRLSLSGGAWVALAAAGTLGGLILAYAVSPYDVGWHLGTSASRTTIGPSLMLLTDITVWAVLSVLAIAPPPTAEDASEPVEDVGAESETATLLS